MAWMATRSNCKKLGPGGRCVSADARSKGPGLDDDNGEVSVRAARRSMGRDSDRVGMKRERRGRDEGERKGVKRTRTGSGQLGGRGPTGNAAGWRDSPVEPAEVMKDTSSRCERSSQTEDILRDVEVRDQPLREQQIGIWPVCVHRNSDLEQVTHDTVKNGRTVQKSGGVFRWQL
ncbi:hypothetical protein BC826DRAFT_1151956 [Russula brevipes]|nr:hypothetical protein BC826DRAFT_1151956 [Russula brevipes]